MARAEADAGGQGVDGQVVGGVIGAVGSAIVGVVWLGERLSPGQVVCLVLIAAGIVGLRLLAPETVAVPGSEA